jgi:hypothetical protein
LWFLPDQKMTHEFLCVSCLWFGKGRRHGNAPPYRQTEGRKLGGKEGNVWRRGAFRFFLYFSRSTSPSFHLLFRPINQPCVSMWIENHISIVWFFLDWNHFSHFSPLAVEEEEEASFCVSRQLLPVRDLVEDF